MAVINNNVLIGQIFDEFIPRFAPHGVVRYAADEQWQRENPKRIEDLGATPRMLRRMPDVLIHHRDSKQLILMDVSTSQGTITDARRNELTRMYVYTSAKLTLVTAFSNRNEMSAAVEGLAWGTVVWIADEPQHLIHFNGDKFLRPYHSEAGALHPDV